MQNTAKSTALTDTQSVSDNWPSSYWQWSAMDLHYRC